VSPREQEQRIATACEHDGLELVDVVQELDVSGGTPLDRRPGLRRAVEMVESGDVSVLVVAYFDRLVRSLTVQREVVERVEKAGGGIIAVDVGEVRADTASRWLSSTMLGMVAEYHRRVTAERTQDAKRRAVARGVPPFPLIPPGYRRTDEGQIEPDPEQAPAVTEAFRLRAGGATVMQVREHLRQHGVERSFHGTQALLKSRIPLGEFRFGELVNTDSHLAIVEPAVWQAVQRMRSPRGRRATSERLLARLGVLRCASCGSRMVVGTTTQGGKVYGFYRCRPVGDCTRRVTISADAAEQAVVAFVRDVLEGMRGTASIDDGIGEAERALDASEKELDAAVRAFTSLEDVDAARERLSELREKRDRARDRLAELQDAAIPAVAITATGDWDRLTLDEQRALVRAVVDRADVSPGRGPDRITFKLRSE
jgi:DNA invertase Pin-like site-specific DNA recombinase